MAEYLGMDELERSATVPELPGAYIWSFDFGHFLGGGSDYVDDGIRRFLAEQGRKASKQDVSSTIEWRAARPALDAKRRRLLADLMSADTPVAKELSAAATTFQRPLYVGITSNLRRRTDEHINSSRDLESRLLRLNIRDCCLWWLGIPPELCLKTTQQPGDLGTATQGVVQGHSEDAGATGAEIRLDTNGDMDHVPPIDEVDRQQLSELAKSIESLLIRTCQPYFNYTTDS